MTFPEKCEQVSNAAAKLAEWSRDMSGRANAQADLTLEAKAEGVLPRGNIEGLRSISRKFAKHAEGYDAIGEGLTLAMRGMRALLTEETP